MSGTVVAPPPFFDETVLKLRPVIAELSRLLDTDDDAEILAHVRIIGDRGIVQYKNLYITPPHWKNEVTGLHRVRACNLEPATAFVLGRLAQVLVTHFPDHWLAGKWTRDAFLAGVYLSVD